MKEILQQLRSGPSPHEIAEKEREREANRVLLEGEVPSPENPPKGCAFYTRCPRKQEVFETKKIDCSNKAPLFAEAKPGHWTACHLYT